MGWHRTAVVGLFWALTLGCGQPTVDSSSPESFEVSLAQIRGSLDGRELKAFDSAVQAIALDGFELDDLLVHGVFPTGDDLARRTKDRFDGMTAAEIIARARELKE